MCRRGLGLTRLVSASLGSATRPVGPDSGFRFTGICCSGNFGPTNMGIVRRKVPYRKIW